MPDILKLRMRADGIDRWLETNEGHNCKDVQAHLDEGTAERAYWHFGYMMALRDVLRLAEEPPNTVN